MEFHEVANIFPMMGEDEYKQLVEDIRVNGLREDIWTYQGKIIDGRNRDKACLEVGITPQFREWDGKGSLVAFVVSLNLNRRHLSSSQKAMVALEVEKQIGKEVQKKEESRKKESTLEIFPKSSTPTPVTPQIHAAKQAATMTGTNTHYVTDAKRIVEKAPELAEHIKSGMLTVPDAKAISNMPEERRPAVLEKAFQKKESEGKRTSKSVKEAIAEEKHEIKRGLLAEQAKSVVLPDTVKIVHGDFRSISYMFSDSSVDLIFTDPPYDEESLQLWSDLSSFASRVLRPGGILLAYSGQSFLPEVLSRLAESLDYCWLLGIQHTGGHIQIWKHTIWNDWKPIVMFSKGNPVEHEWLMDLYRGGDKGDKDAHEWAQGEGEAAYYIEKFTTPGQFVVDPMCGSGTILRAAHKLSRHTLGVEIDESRYNSALGGMKELEDIAI